MQASQMTKDAEKHPAQLLFDALLREIRKIVQIEIATARTDLVKRVGRVETILPKNKRLYSLKETAVELNLSEATVRRLLARGLLRSSKATRHIRIPREQIDNFVRIAV
jgi:excisionase family DNA binding protein